MFAELHRRPRRGRPRRRRVFDGVCGNPTASAGEAGVAAYRAHGADCVVGIGGGAALDVAKVVGADGHARRRRVRVRVGPSAGARRSTTTLPYFVALPTTGGHRQRGRPQRGDLRGRHPRQADHLLARRSWPRRCSPIPSSRSACRRAVTAATGMDALTHNIESYLSPAYHPLCDGIALEGMRIAARALRHRGARAAATSQARGDMMMSSMMGAIAFQKDLGAVHSCAHALGTVCDLHHGLANALMIDTRAAPSTSRPRRTKFAELAHVVGVERRRAEASSPGCATLKARRSASPPRAVGARGVKREHDPARWSRSPSPTSATRPIRGRCTAADFERLFARGDVSDVHCTAARPLQGRHLGVLLPRRPDAADLHGQDAAVRRAVDRALGHVERRARGDDPEPGRRHAAGRRQRSTTTSTGSTAWCCRAAPTSRPTSYGETPLQPEWEGDAIRDDYEIEPARAPSSTPASRCSASAAACS